MNPGLMSLICTCAVSLIMYILKDSYPTIILSNPCPSCSILGGSGKAAYLLTHR